MKEMKNIKRSIITSIIVVLALLIFPFLFNFVSSYTVINKIFYIIFSVLSLILLSILLYYKDKLEKHNEKISTITFTINSIMIAMFISLCFISVSTVSGNSMNNTYKDNDKIITWTFNIKPKIDDVVIIDMKNYDLNDSSKYIIKRVVATSSDKVEYKDYALYVNDEYVQSMTSYEYTILLSNDNDTFEKVPEGYSVVLGDNRNNSLDSRSIGLINNNDIVGKSIFRIYPLNSLGVPKKDL